MRYKTKISLVLFAIGLMIPGFMVNAVAVQENWGVAEGEDYEYTFGITGEVLLPASVWDLLSEEAANGLNQDFNNSYEVGYANAYEEGYEDGFLNVSGGFEDPWDFVNPYPNTFNWNTIEEGQYFGYDNGYYSGYMDLWNFNGWNYHNESDGWYWNSESEYLGVDEFPGFPQAELDAFDLEHVYTEFMNLDKIFNLNIHIDDMDELTEVRDWGVPAEYYWDTINITLTMKLAGDSTYLPFENFLYAYMDTNIRDFIAAAFPFNMAGNITAQLDEALGHLNDEILDGHDIAENLATAWGTGSNLTVSADWIAEQLMLEVASNFGMNIEQEYSYDYGYYIGYDEGYDDGFAGMSYSNPYYWDSEYESGLHDGYSNGWNNGYYDYDYSNPYGYNYWNYEPDEMYRNEVQVGPSGYGRTPFFIPTDLDVGAQIELAKDAMNIELARSHVIFATGGVNGIIEQMGLDFVTNEKQVYVEGNLEDPKWMLGEILDIGSMLLIDQLNEEIMTVPELDFELMNDTMEAYGIFNLQWDENGVLLNMHEEMHIGVSYLPDSLLGATFMFDLSRGEWDALGAHFGYTTPSQKPYPTTVYGDWGVDEGSVTDFTSSFDLNVEMPQSMWDRLSDQLWEGMNYTYYDWTGMNLPVSEVVDAELIFESLMAEIPNVVNLQSKVTDMLGVFEGNETDYHEYDFLAQYLLAKVPSNPSYEPVGMLFYDIYEGFMDAIDASFPPSFAAELEARLEFDLADLIESSYIEGTQISILEVLQQFVPSSLHMWGIAAEGDVYGDMDGFVMPDFATELGIVDPMYIQLLSEGIALPSVLYTPTDFAFGDVYADLIPFLEDISDGNFTEPLLYEFLTNMSVDDFVIDGKQIYIRMDVETTDDILFQTTGATEGLEDYLNQMGNNFSEQFIYNSVWAKFLFNWEYDEDGILKNLHLQIGAGVETSGGEELSVAAEIDMSQGEFAGKNGQFFGEPLIHGYNHWLYPDLTYSLILPQGAGNVVNIDSDYYDIHMGLEFSTTDQVRLSTQIWGDDPSTSNLFIPGTGVYFAIDGDDEAAIQFPMTLTVDLRPELITAAGGNVTLLEELFTIYTWDETADNWVLEDGFTTSIDLVSETVTISITHLSAFAIGVVAPPDDTDDDTTDDDTTDDDTTDDDTTDDDTTDDDTTDDDNPFGGIPGYGLSFFLISIVGTAALLIMRKRK